MKNFSSLHCTWCLGHASTHFMHCDELSDCYLTRPHGNGKKSKPLLEELGQLVGRVLPVGLVIEKLRVWIPARVTEEFTSPKLNLSAGSYCSPRGKSPTDTATLATVYPTTVLERPSLERKCIERCQSGSFCSWLWCWCHFVNDRSIYISLSWRKKDSYFESRQKTTDL